MSPSDPAAFACLRSVAVPILILQANQIVWANDAAAALTGYDALDLCSRSCSDLLAPHGRSPNSDRPLSGETELITAQGEAISVDATFQPAEIDGKALEIATIIDIRSRKRLEGTLSQRDSVYRRAIEASLDAFYLLRSERDESGGIVDFVFTDVNPAGEAMIPSPRHELIGKRVSEVFPHERGMRFLQIYIKVAETGRLLDEDFELTRVNGIRHWYHHQVLPVEDGVTVFIREISQRKEMEAILLEQERLRFDLQKEQELNEVKTNLMRTISHEFRTPLASIVTATDMLDKYSDRLDSERRAERFQSIRMQVKRLSDMLDDINFVVHGTLHHMTAHLSHINLEAYCREIIEDIQTSIGTLHQFNFTTDGTLAQGIADKALIVRILSNLLSNAVKYSPEGSTITVALYRQGSAAILEVRDQGIGIQPEDLKRIFEPFYRGKGVLDAIGGTGLGLGIVKECVELQGGTITVTSEPGSGTAFTIRLPQTGD